MQKKTNTCEYICKADIVQIVIIEKNNTFTVFISTALKRDQSNNGISAYHH
jgi:hypothetical protein